MTFLGMLIDAENQLVAIPIEKLIKGKNMIDNVLRKKKLTLLQLQKICGFLNFLGRSLIPGRAFTRRLYSYIKINLKPHHHININKEMKLDFLLWQEFLGNPNVYCRPFMDFSEILVANEINFYTDSSKNPELGFGGMFGESYMYAKWNKNFIIENDPSITYLELYVVAAAILAWGKLLANRRVIIFCDNIGICGILNHMSSTCKNCMILVRLIVMNQMVNNSRIFAKWVPTKLNGPADALSRLKIDKFLKLQKFKVDKIPTAIPTEIWPMEKVFIKK